jgi:hypothetical protein
MDSIHSHAAPKITTKIVWRAWACDLFPVLTVWGQARASIETASEKERGSAGIASAHRNRPRDRWMTHCSSTSGGVRQQARNPTCDLALKKQRGNSEPFPTKACRLEIFGRSTPWSRRKTSPYRGLCIRCILGSLALTCHPFIDVPCFRFSPCGGNKRAARRMRDDRFDQLGACLVEIR